MFRHNWLFPRETRFTKLSQLMIENLRRWISIEETENITKEFPHKKAPVPGSSTGEFCQICKD